LIESLSEAVHTDTFQLEKSLEAAEAQRSTEARSIRTVDRTVRDLQSQIDRREKQNTAISEDLGKARDKISNLLSTIDELQTSDSTNQLAAKRAERDLREERERALRLERELEGWKSLRLERGSTRGGLAVPDFTGSQSGGSVRGLRESSVGILSPDRNRDSLDGPLAGKPSRRVSATKGFL
jgi:myosin protein heavy chain